MKTTPIHGARYVWRGLRLIRAPGLRRFVAVPLALNTLLFAGLIWYGANEFEAFIDSLLPAWLDWLRWLLWPLFAVTALLVMFYLFTLVANLIAAPFNGLLAARVEELLTGQYPNSAGAGWKDTLAGVLPGIASEVGKLLYFIGWSVPLLILFLIPGLNVLAPFLWFAFSARMLAMEYLDYPMGNHGLPFREQRSKQREKPLLVLGFGTAALLLTMIPVLNFLAMPTAVAGATAMWVEQWRKRPDSASTTG